VPIIEQRHIDELRRSGGVTRRTYTAIRRVITAHVARCGIPAPSGGDRWTRDAVDDLTQDLFTRRGGAETIIVLAVSGAAPEHFENQIS
jgi:hypothetical protein